MLKFLANQIALGWSDEKCQFLGRIMLMFLANHISWLGADSHCAG